MSGFEIPFGTTLHPSEEEFRDFRKFVNKLSQNPSLQRAGFVKIIPPPSFLKESVWKPELLGELKVVSPIEQRASANNGLFELSLVSRRSMVLGEYKRRVDQYQRDSQLVPYSPLETLEKKVGSPVLAGSRSSLSALWRGCKIFSFFKDIDSSLEHAGHAFSPRRHRRPAKVAGNQRALPLHRRIRNHVLLAHRRLRHELDQLSPYRRGKNLVLHRQKRRTSAREVGQGKTTCRIPRLPSVHET